MKQAAIIIVLIVTQSLHWGDKPPEKSVIRLDDLNKKFEVQGRLGIPLKTVVTITGRWQENDDEGLKVHEAGFATKPDGPWLKIHEIDGNPCEPILFRGDFVRPYELGDRKEKSGTWTARAFEVIDMEKTTSIAYKEVHSEKQLLAGAHLPRETYEPLLLYYRVSVK